MSEERTAANTGSRTKLKLAVGAVAVGALALFGGAAYAQQNGGQDGAQQQAPGTQEEQQRNGSGGSGADREDCPWGQQNGEQQSQTTSEV